MGDYNSPLIFEKEELEVRGNETGFEIKLKDGTILTLRVPQRERNGKMIDEEDRIVWGISRIQEVLDQIAQENETMSLLPQPLS